MRRVETAPSELIDALRARLAAEGIVALRVRVRPGKHQTRVVPEALGDVDLVLDIHALAREDAANGEAQGFLAELFAVSRAQVSLVAGRSNPRKVFEIRKIRA